MTNQLVGTDTNGAGKAGFLLNGLCNHGPGLLRASIEMVHASHICVKFS